MRSVYETMKVGRDINMCVVCEFHVKRSVWEVNEIHSCSGFRIKVLRTVTEWLIFFFLILRY